MNVIASHKFVFAENIKTFHIDFQIFRSITYLRVYLKQIIVILFINLALNQ